MKIIMCIFFPPIGVAMKGRSAGQIILNLLLCIIGYIPGVLHALIINDESGKTIVKHVTIVQHEKDFV